MSGGSSAFQKVSGEKSFFLTNAEKSDIVPPVYSDDGEQYPARRCKESP